MSAGPWNRTRLTKSPLEETEMTEIKVGSPDWEFLDDMVARLGAEAVRDAVERLEEAHSDEGNERPDLEEILVNHFRVGGGQCVPSIVPTSGGFKLCLTFCGGCDPGDYVE